MLALFGACSVRQRRRLWLLDVQMLFPSFVLVRVPAEQARLGACCCFISASILPYRTVLVRVWSCVLPVLPWLDLMDARTRVLVRFGL